jgi:anti-sigma B factor antagonist
LDIPHETVGTVLVVTPPHESLDASTTRDFKRDLIAVIGAHTQVVLDLSHIQLLDSSACGVLISLLRQAKGRDGDVKLCAVTPPVRSLFELVRMHKVFDIFNTRAEAVRAFQV